VAFSKASKEHAKTNKSGGSQKSNRAYRFKQGHGKMARFDLQNIDAGHIGGTAETDVLFEMGIMYATGRDCDVDHVAAHKWFNIAAIKGSDRAAELRAELVKTMSKSDLATAMRQAREWMTSH
jgi:TPR repeat protein